VASARLAENVLEVCLQLLDGVLVRELAVAGDDDLDVEREDPVAGVDPVADRPGPDDRMALV
jgi:hypothetical protein